jgi:RimJ/RimL family protein N-acetyltransferase
MSITFNPEIAYTLEDDRVLLRPLLAADFEYLLPFALNEPDTWNYSLTSAAGEDGMRAYIDAAVKGRAMGKEYPFIVFDKVNGEYAGTTRFYDIQPAYQTLQLGYTWYGEKFRGTGLNKHCKFLLLQFAFDQLGIERVEFRADARNQRSIAAMNLSKTYQSAGRTLTVLDNINFSITEGSTNAIVGPSGSGKTTLLGLCAGLDRSSTGSVN